MTIQSVQPFEFNHLLKIWIIQVFESTCVFFNKHHNDCQDDGRCACSQGEGDSYHAQVLPIMPPQYVQPKEQAT